ncbi:rCG62208, partial [Rattus norvegicus]
MASPLSPSPLLSTSLLLFLQTSL